MAFSSCSFLIPNIILTSEDPWLIISKLIFSLAYAIVLSAVTPIRWRMPSPTIIIIER